MKKNRSLVNEFSAKERILIIEVNWMGDVLFSTPAIRAIRERFPGAFISVLIVRRCKDLFIGNNYIDEFMVLDENERHKGFFGKLRLIRQLKLRRFTIAYMFHWSLTRLFCVFLAGVKNRIGYAGRKSSFLLTERVALPQGDIHRADESYFLVTKTRIPAAERYYDFFVSAEDKAYIDNFLKGRGIDPKKKVVVLHVGGNWSLKLWPEENFIRLIDALNQNYNAQVLIAGSYMDYPRAQSIASKCALKPVIACGMTTLAQLGALFQKSDLVISADSGPMHIAIAIQARTIALFGPTSAMITGPFGRGEFSVIQNQNTKCVIPCYNLGCNDNVCMGSITVEQVLGEVKRRGWLK